MTAPALAIDFGTSRTKVAYFDGASGKAQLVELGREIRSVLPSVFYIPKEGQGERLVGDDAQDMVDSDPEGIVLSLKKELHKLGKKRCGPERPAIDRIQLASDLFSHINQRCRTEVFHDQEIKRCQLTVPVDFKAQQREAIREAAKLGGFEEITLIEEPIAAAQHWLRNHRDGKFGNSVVVCDVGGGTTDFAFLRYANGRFQSDDQVLSDGFPTGGNDLDEAIWEMTTGSDPNRAQYDSQTPGFLVHIRRQRELISKTQNSDIQFIVHGLQCTIPRSTFEAVTAEFVDRVKTETARFLEKVASQAKVTNAPILLVGGASKLPGLRDALKSLNQGEVFLWSDSDYATVLGAVHGDATATKLPGLERSRGPAVRGLDIHYDLYIASREAALGAKKVIVLSSLRTCDACKGSGGVSGTVAKDYTCPTCQGEGRVKRETKINVSIPAGAEDGSRLRSKGQGESGARGGLPGDLYVVLHVETQGPKDAITIQDHTLAPTSGKAPLVVDDETVAKMRMDAGDWLLMTKECFLVIWRFNPINASAYNFCDSLRTLDVNTPNPKRAEVVGNVLASIQLQAFTEFANGLTSGVITIVSMFQNELISQAARACPNSEDYLRSAFARSPKTDYRIFQTGLENAIVTQRDAYSRLTAHFSQLKEYFPRYHALMNRSGFQEFMAGLGIGAVFGIPGIIAASIWDNWRGSSDSEFLQKFGAAIDQYVTLCNEFTVRGEQALDPVYDRMIDEMRSTYETFLKAVNSLQTSGTNIYPIYLELRKPSKGTNNDSKQLLQIALSNLSANSHVSRKSISNLTAMIEPL